MAAVIEETVQTNGVPEEITLETVLSLALRLRPVDQAKLMTRLAPQVESVLEIADISSASIQPRQTSVRGILADLGPAPSAEDIDEVRREMWASLDTMEV